MKRTTTASLAVLCCLAGGSPGLAAESEAEHLRLSGIPFNRVTVQDGFWSPRLTTNREKSIPHNLRWCEETGRIANFVKAAGKAPGAYEGLVFNDSDVYKVIEGVSYSLAAHPDPELKAKLDAIITTIAAAQQPDGYLNTYFTLAKPGQRWTDFRRAHELYCAGHLIEAAVAHFRATGEYTLLHVAQGLADHLVETFGPEGRLEVPGHEEIELALMRLYDVDHDERYFQLAQFFVDLRGDSSRRPQLFGEYCQDHKPATEQTEVVGHAVRAMYFYCGAADVASYTGDIWLRAALQALWENLTSRKMYITGGIGARHAGEAFGDDYELPNQSAYCETCAAIGLVRWARRMNAMNAQATYADVMERALYNGVLSGIGLDGVHFFYVNPLASGGGHHRQPFFPCACCPTNVVRTVPSLPGYIYAQSDDALHVNLYVGSRARVTLQSARYSIEQSTRYPWDGHVELSVRARDELPLTLALRVPQWCRRPTFQINGEDVKAPAIKHGYARFERTWLPDDRITVELPMPVERMEAHPKVTANAGRVALQRGPIVYCFEACDNDGRVSNIVLAKDPQFRVEHRPDLLGGVTVIHALDRSGRPLMAVPYYAWDHREPGEMAVWVRQDGKEPNPPAEDPNWTEKLYRPLDPATLTAVTELAPSEAALPSASHCFPRDNVGALNDLIEPRTSSDASVPRHTWWDRRGSAEWVQYEFQPPRRVSAVEVYWFDDTRAKGHCRAPESWRVLFKSGDQWKPVVARDPYATALNQYNRVTFEPIETTALRIEAQLKPDFSGGILEWKVE